MIAIIFWLMFTIQVSAVIYGVFLLHKVAEAQLKLQDSLVEYLKVTKEFLSNARTS